SSGRWLPRGGRCPLRIGPSSRPTRPPPSPGSAPTQPTNSTSRRTCSTPRWTRTTSAANSPPPVAGHGNAAEGGFSASPMQGDPGGPRILIAHAARVTHVNVYGRALVRDRRRLHAGGSVAGPSRRGVGDTGGDGLRVQRAAT